MHVLKPKVLMLCFGLHVEESEGCCDPDQATLEERRLLLPQRCCGCFVHPLNPLMNEHTKQAPQPVCCQPEPCNVTPSRLLLHSEGNVFVLEGPVYMYRTDQNDFKHAVVLGVVAGGGGTMKPARCTDTRCAEEEECQSHGCVVELFNQL